jgi:hypothetical protein
MASVSTGPAKPANREALRRELLKLIVKNEANRRDQRKASQK